MQVDSLMNKYNPRDPQRRAMEKRAAEIDAHYTKRAKKLDATSTAGNNFNSAYKSYGLNGIDMLLVGHFDEVNKMIQAINLFSSEGGRRITRGRKNDSCELNRSQKERCLSFVEEDI